MFWVIYNLFFSVVFLIMLPRFALRMIKRGGYRHGFLERFGCFSKAGLERAGNVPRLWIHAVSVGESQLAFRFAESHFGFSRTDFEIVFENAIPPFDLLFQLPPQRHGAWWNHGCPVRILFSISPWTSRYF